MAQVAPTLIPQLCFVLGGTRSGKSRFAQNLALSLSDRPVYLATSQAFDADHRERIARHQLDRGSEWETIEEPVALSKIPCRQRVVVVDCVTLWLTNYFLQERDVDHCLEQAIAELDRMLQLPNRYIVVSNEVGQSLHAPTDTGRKFTDLQGFMNQALAARAKEVVLMVAGVPLYVKGRPGDESV
jgi:adenosylcobinamide kinase/adenosylcobinamide-phosphate guanylyltransferase